jgi:WD40 repeat protein
VRLWDVETGEVLHSFTGHEAEVQSAVLSPDRRHALSGSRDKTLRLWRLPK